MITAKILAHSKSVWGPELVTFELTYQRFIHPQVLQHRAFARNSSSSRAIPLKRRIEQVRTNPAVPVKFGANKAGMVAGEDFDKIATAEAMNIWLKSADLAADQAEKFLDSKVHKQWAARILEPYLWHTVVISGTDWEYFLALREAEDSQPEIQELAHKIRQALEVSKPEKLFWGDWHLPYLSDAERITMSLELQVKISAARCARASYENQLGHDLDKDLELYDRLVALKHDSPREHQATPVGLPWIKPKGCFDGFHQLRHTNK